MFDSVPPNLPVEPVTPPPAAPVAPPSPPPQTPEIMTPPMPMSTGGKKEPEDIFSGLDQTPTIKGGMPKPVGSPPSAFPVKLVAMIAGAVVVLALVGGAVYFFVLKPKAVTPAPAVSSAPAPTKPIGIPTTPAPVVEQPPAAAIPTPTEQPMVTSTPVAELPVTTPPAGINVPPPTAVTPPVAISSPPAVVTEGKDSDADQLTDAEEPYYNADMTKSDTDGDGFSDGSEVANLYDPSVKGGALDSATYMTHLAWGGLTFLLPKPWSILPVADQPNQARIATGSATRFNLEWILNPEKRSFDGLLAGKGISATHSLTTKRGYEARQSDDGMTTYIAIGDKVLQITYDLNGDMSYDYRSSFAMIVQSVLLTQTK